MLPHEVEGIALRPDGAELWVTNRKVNRITVLAADDLAVRGTIESADYPLRVRFTPDGRLALVTLGKSSELKIFDATTRREVAKIAMRVPVAALHGGTGSEGYETKTAPIGVALSSDGAWAFVANAGVDAVTVVSMRDREIAAIVFVGHEPDGIAWSPLVRAPAGAP